MQTLLSPGSAPEPLISLTSDMVFKAVFGSPGSEDVLGALLSAVRQDYGFPEVTELEITNPFNLQSFRTDKLSVVDARERSLPEFVYNDHLSLHLLELPGFDSGARTSHTATGEEKPQFPSTPLERWVYFIRRAGVEDELMKKIKEQEPMIARADEKYRSFMNDEDSFFASLEHERWVRDRAQMILDGEERGLAKGLEQGLERAAVKMLAKGMDEQLIGEITGLSPAELAELKPKM